MENHRVEEHGYQNKISIVLIEFTVMFLECIFHRSIQVESIKIHFSREVKA
jgi:hypothetical protein